MFVFLYHFMWTLVFLLVIPLLPLITKRKRIAERLSLSLPPASLKGESIWIHALSVGEVISALPLIKALSIKYPDKGIVFTVTTSKGMGIAKRELKGNVKALLPMPIDFWWCIRRMVNHVRPSAFILIETDIWPGLIDYLGRRGIKSVLVNGRVSPRTFRSYRRFSIFTRMMLEPLESCLMQSDLDRERLLQAGIDPDRVRTVGNIKYDRDWVPMANEERQKLLRALNLGVEDMIWVAGSTHAGEEEVVLRTFKKLRPSFARFRLILAPRKIERSEDILVQARDMGLETVLKTGISRSRDPYDVMILDTLGELGRIYGLSKVSFVGGSLVPIGGHNLLEPAGFGCPVLFGPHTHNFVFMSESLLEAGGGWRVKDAEALYEAMKTLLKDTEKCNVMGRLAKAFVEKNRGALERVMSYIAECISRSRGISQ
ncbi:MAG: 3-deoxy-D-manno-octulosonic acid transferase [Deltaproteobacteria bacterium]|nr:3-deoxy-D-manno-octulosonic acid transferase [Deltaproteobacteria bacterium]MBW2343446.1 3-deoxy-D-manno-octulosonic acid transferase [Deltaproteobacteria bacterium]